MWETVTALTSIAAGCDFLMMMHPKAIQTVKDVIQRLTERSSKKSLEMADWISLKA
jgi:acetyl-CoA decarbonylase/synthase complex subunit delta